MDTTESVWDYPRPPRLERTVERLRVIHQGTTLADTTGGFRVLETSHPPVYYFPPGDVRRDRLQPSPARRSFCEFKGLAVYWKLIAGAAKDPDIGWSYPEPAPGFEALRDFVAFYPGRVDECWVADERVTAQPGDFYGGWITSRIRGPFKGGPGTMGW